MRIQYNEPDPNPDIVALENLEDAVRKHAAEIKRQQSDSEVIEVEAQQ